MYKELIKLIKCGYISDADSEYLAKLAKKCDRLFEEGILYRDSDRIVKAEEVRKEIYDTIEFLYDDMTYNPAEDISTYETNDY